MKEPTTSYRQPIQAVAPDHDPRHVEAFMRDARGTLDALSPAEFDREVAIAVQCIEAGGVDFAEALAASYGL